MTGDAEPREWTNPPGVYAPQAHYSQVARVANGSDLARRVGADLA